MRISRLKGSISELLMSAEFANVKDGKSTLDRRMILQKKAQLVTEFMNLAHNLRKKIAN